MTVLPRVLTYKRGYFAWQEAFAFLIVAVPFLLACWYGYEHSMKIPVGADLFQAIIVGAFMIVAGGFLGKLQDDSRKRFDRDHDAAGALNTAFWGILEYAAGGQAVPIEGLMYDAYCLIRNEKNMGEIEADDLHELMQWARGLEGNLGYYSCGHLESIRRTLGGIAHRQQHPILLSTFIVNYLFTAVAITLMTIMSFQNGEIQWGSMGLAVLFGYGVVVIHRTIRHFEDGFGFHPGDVDPIDLLLGWLRKLNRFRRENKLTPIVLPEKQHV